MQEKFVYTYKEFCLILSDYPKVFCGKFNKQFQWINIF